MTRPEPDARHALLAGPSEKGRRLDSQQSCGLPRVKQVLQRFGFDVSGTVELETSDLIDLKARAQCLLEEYEDKLTGRRQIRLRVPYLGYESVNENGHG